MGSFSFTDRRIPSKGVVLKVRCFQSIRFPPRRFLTFLLDSLAIIVPSIPEGGTKSRVETQVRVTVDLAHASATGGDNPSQYDRVGSWKWLRLPKGSAMKKRTRKEGKIGLSILPRPSAFTYVHFPLEPLVEDTLQLGVGITCASPPHSRVVCCSSCQAREVCHFTIFIDTFH
jgi:uncharacterized protein